MTLRHMEIFHALCQNGYNTTKAAQSLNMTQPAVSLAIKELENYYDVLLFDRLGKKLVITAAGKRFEEYTTSIGHLFYDMQTEMRNWGKQGEVHVGATFTIGSLYLPFYIRNFEQKYPETQVKAHCVPANILEEKILNNQLDFGFSEGVVQNPSIESQPYMDDYIAIVSAANGKYSAGQEISLEEFLSNRLILREKSSGTRKIFDAALEKMGYVAEAYMESISNTAIISSAGCELGLGVISSRVAKHAIDAGWVVQVFVKGLDLNRKFYIIRHKDKRVSPAAQSFLDLCEQTGFEAKLID